MRRSGGYYLIRTVLSTLVAGTMIFVSYRYYAKRNAQQGDMSGPEIVSAEDFHIEDAKVMYQSFMDISLNKLEETILNTEHKGQTTYQYSVKFSHVNEKEELTVQQEIIQYASQTNTEYVPDEYYIEIELELHETNEAAQDNFVNRVTPCAVHEKRSELLKACGNSCINHKVNIESEEEMRKYLTFGDANHWGCDEVVYFYGTAYFILGNRTLRVDSNVTPLDEEASEYTIEAIKKVLNYDFTEEIQQLKSSVLEE